MQKDQETTESTLGEALTLDDLTRSQYEEVLLAEPDGLQYGWSNTFMERHLAAKEAGDTRRARVYAILNAVTSMLLSPETPATPFRPGTQWPDGTRSPIPEDLAPDVVNWLALVAPHVANVDLRTRMADLVWLRDKRHGIQIAQLAIDGYAAGSLKPDDWTISLGAEWKRALQLAKGIGKPGAERFAAIVQQLQDAFRACAVDLDEAAAPLWYVAILYDLRVPGIDAAAIASELADLGHRHAATGNYWLARSFFDAAGNWYDRAKDPAQRIAMLYQVAKHWEAQGDAVGADIAALHHYQKAVQAYRDVPAAQRDVLAGAGAVERVRQKVLDAGKLARGQMRSIKGPSIEVSRFIAYAQQRVQCLSPIDALFAFITLEQAPSAAAHRQGAIDSLSSSIGRLFSSTTLADDGRAVESHEGGLMAEPTEAEILSEMVKAFDRQAQLIGGTMVGPGLYEMRRQFGLSQGDFAFIAEHSPMVQRDRVDLVAKGLHAGFCLDFIQATHILLPQFENMVRMLLKAAGALTTTHADGIDMEIGLSSLVDKPEMVTVFGEDVTFEIRALMCHQQGANLRNAVAHGQADSALCETPQAVYAWWLILRLVVEAFHAMAVASEAGSEENTEVAVAEEVK